MSSPELQLSLSTCWNSARHTDGYEMIEEIRELGFRQVELSHGIRAYLVPGIMKAVEEDLITISSVHNFCPLPSAALYAAPNLYQPSAKSREERDTWLTYSRNTIEFAKKIGTSHVVMHSGRVDFRFRSPEPTLAKTESRSDEKNRAKALQRLKKKSEKTIQLVMREYGRLLPSAAENDIMLCLENREGICELPLDSEFSSFFQEMGDSNHLAYWHDTGHAQIKDHLGLLDHEQHLEKLADRLTGWHLHDVSDEGRDHQVPGTGTVDFKMLSQYFRPEHILVIELSPRLSREDVLKATNYLLGLL